MKRKLGRHLSLFFYSFHFCFTAPVPTLIDIRPASTSIYCLVNPTLSGYVGPQRFLFSSIGKTLDAVWHIGTHSFVIQLDLWVDGNNKSRSVYTSITRSPAFFHWSRSWRTRSLRKWNKEVFFRSTFWRWCSWEQSFDWLVELATWLATSIPKQYVELKSTRIGNQDDTYFGILNTVAREWFCSWQKKKKTLGCHLVVK